LHLLDHHIHAVMYVWFLQVMLDTQPALIDPEVLLPHKSCSHTTSLMHCSLYAFQSSCITVPAPHTTSLMLLLVCVHTIADASSVGTPLASHHHHHHHHHHNHYITLWAGLQPEAAQHWLCQNHCSYHYNHTPGNHCYICCPPACLPAVKRGDRIAQLVLERIVTPAVLEVEELDDTARGANGFGSTGVAVTVTTTATTTTTSQQQEA
jgi:hypothetical protein